MMHAPLRESDLLANGSLRRLGSRVILLDEVDSTNAFLLRNAAELPDGTIVAAEHQSAGRGRQGRQWVAPRGSSLLISVLFIRSREQTRGGEPLELHATALAAVAACEAIEATTDCRPELRWPNDLVAGGRKLGGVLAETCGLASGHRAVVIGVGLNCLQQAGHFAGELEGKATSLELLSAGAIDRGRIAGAVVERLDACAAIVESKGGGSELWSAWRRRCTDIGGRVALRSDGQAFSGTVLDVTERGDLDVQLDLGGRRRFEAAITTRNW